jgi:hypothetical protein
MSAVGGQANADGSAAIMGIQCTPTSSGNLVSGNKIHGLSLINAGTGTVTINGINVNSMTGSAVSRNIIHSFRTSNTGITSTMNGINYTGGSSRIVNNIIRLGIDTAGAAVTATPVISGINKKGGSIEAYFNSVYIGGSNIGTGLANTYAFNKTASGTDVVQNNIFVNERANAGTGGGHYVVALNNNTNLNLNYNVYHHGPLGTGDTLGVISGTGVTSILTWRSLAVVDIFRE